MAESQQPITESESENGGGADLSIANVDTAVTDVISVQGPQQTKALVVKDSSHVNIQWNPSIHVKTGETGIPSNIKDQMEAELSQNSDVFQETSGFARCLDILKMYGNAIIAADPGEGKTTLTCGIGRHLRAKGWEDGNLYTPLFIKSPSEWRQFVTPKKYQLVVIDDMFGTHDLSTDMLNQWLTFLPSIEACVKRNAGTLLLIIASRKSILLRAKDHLAKFKLFDSKKVVDLSLECNLSRGDLRRIAISHKRRARLELSDKQVEAILQSGMRQGFPRTCDLVLRYGVDPEKVESRFKNPTDILINELQILYNDPNLKALFMLCLHSNGKINTTEALSQSQVEIIKYAGLSQLDTVVQLTQTIKSVPECYLKAEDQGCQKWIKFSHPSVFFAVAQIFANDHLEFLLENCRFELISDIVRLQSDKTRELTTTLGIKKEYEGNLARRFILEILTGNVKSVCSHSAFACKEFTDLFLDQAKQDGHSNILAPVDHAFPLLYWSVWNKAGTLCHTLLTEEYRNRPKKEILEDVFIAVVGACIANNTEALTSLLYLVTPEALIKCFHKRRDLQQRATQTNDYYPSLLHIACRFGNLDIILLVLTHQQEQLKIEHLFQVLSNSVSAGESDVFLLLIKNINMKILSQVFQRWTFPKSFKANIAQIVSYLVKCGAEINFKVSRLYKVSIGGWQKKSKEKEMQFVPTGGESFMLRIIPRSSLIAQTLQGYSPQRELCKAAIAGHIEIVDTMLQLGVDPNLESKSHGQTVLVSCCQTNKIELVECLLRHNVDVNLPNERTQQTPLYYACRAGNTEIAALLLDNGANLIKDLKALHKCLRVACEGGNIDMFSLLIKGGARVNVVWSKDMETPLGIACLENHFELARKVIELGGNVNAPMGQEQETALLRACKSTNNKHLVSLLVEHGAEVNKRSGHDSTSPLEQARQTGCDEIVTYLLEKGAN